ncbi:MAG: ribosome small subunit-dependent GTPase A [Defluviitaleaceae bacterium]|nr:ribosome small subunit-dependent GTPase A [Defluviitaleaceae bacterium]MCL2239655.1 ribosome small subunit-dependent GTPase A [Defluviitaleaceae bacterium]
MTKADKTGLITKGVGGLYAVLTQEGTYACTARGVFRNKKTRSARPVTPLVGDKAEILIENEAENTGTITAIQPRKNALIRPAAANIDQVLITVSAAQPAFNPGLLDRFLVLAAHAGIDAVICVNKCDLMKPALEAGFLPYRMAGYDIIYASAKEASGLNAVREAMAGKLTVLAGPSGVGKSSLINALLPHARQEVGEISSKLKRGKHTTRAAEILPLGDTPQAGYVVDTPGFSSLETEAIPPREMASYFKEFAPYIGQCRFNDCLHAAHDKAEDCAVKAHLGETIHPARYESYIKLL